MDTKDPHLFVPFKKVETWSLTAKKDYYENLRNICIKRKNILPVQVSLLLL